MIRLMLVVVALAAVSIAPTANAAPDPTARTMARTALGQAKQALSMASTARAAVGSLGEDVAGNFDFSICSWAMQQDFNVGMLKLWSLLIDGNEGGPYARVDDRGSCQRLGITRQALSLQSRATPATALSLLTDAHARMASLTP